MKVLLAAFVGGLFVFVWGAVSHMVLPGLLGLGELGTAQDRASEAALLDAMRAAFDGPNVYLIPGVGYDSPDKAEVQAFEERQARGPFAFVVYQPTGQAGMMPKQLALEFLANVLAAFVAAVVLSCTRCAYPTRVLLVVLMGVFAWLSLEASYWNWYRFPDEFALFELIDQAGGWLCGGLMIAAMVQGKEA